MLNGDGPIKDRSSNTIGEAAGLLDRLVLSKEVAIAILNGFNKHFRIFREITREARFHFINGDWPAGRRCVRDRISLYDTRVMECVDTLRQRFTTAEVDPELWQEIKLQYLGLLYNHRQPELAETFYNSVFVALFERTYYHNDNIFIRPSISTERIDGDVPTYRAFYPTRYGWRRTIEQILLESNVGLPFENLRRDVRNVVGALRKIPFPPGGLRQHFQIHVMAPVFYRNKGAYIVGRAINGDATIPFMLPLLRTDSGEVYVDALVHEPHDCANLFSFARAYFLVDCEAPAAVVRFLQTLFPSKSAADLYTAIGFGKQGKNEFYRDFLDHLRHASDQFIVAPGIEGMVMLVFTLPSYPYVFKVIRDQFKPPKEITHKEVIAKHRMIKQYDRIGRIADTWEFSHVAFPVDRFEARLLDEIKREVPRQIELEGDSLIIKRCFIERRLNPLNLYLEQGTQQEIEHGLIEFGYAVKDIGAIGIFAGDLLMKNFGMTRHERVIFYDYDEIVPIGEVNFRDIPPPRTPEDEMAAEPWYSVGPADVFPEEFPTFLLTKPRWRKLFMSHHADLCTADFWRELQQTVADGGFPDVFPYNRRIRFERAGPAAGN